MTSIEKELTSAPAQIEKGNEVRFDTQEENLYFNTVLDIDPKELYLKQDRVTLVDVRQSEEYTGDLGHIPGSKLIGLHELSERADEIDRNQTIVFVCRNGSRSARACAIAKELGLDRVYNLKGGMILWNELHYRTED